LVDAAAMVLRDTLLGNERLVEEFTADFKRELARLRKEGHGARRRLLRELQDSPAWHQMLPRLHNRGRRRPRLSWK